MKTISVVTCLALSLFLGVLTSGPANSKIITNVPADISGSELKAVVVEDFETAEVGDKGWQVETKPKKIRQQGCFRTETQDERSGA